MKTCTKCNTPKELDQFHKDKTAFDGYSSRCKKCKYEYNEQNKEQSSIKHKEHYSKNKEKHLKRNRDNYFKNQDKHIQYHKNHYKNNKEKHAELSKKWREKKYPRVELTEEELRLKYNKRKLENKIRSLIKEAIKQQLKNSKAVLLLGCSVLECKLHLESKFKPEMNWENYGIIWEMDHIIGCCNFDIFKLEEQQKCFHYTNLQPLFKTTKIAESFGYVNYIGNRNKLKK